MKKILEILLCVSFILMIGCNDGGGDGGDDNGDSDNPLIVHYSFDEGYGNIALNGTSNKKSGYIVGASRVEGKLGNALLFGSGDSRVEIDTVDFGRKGLITVEAWIKPNMIEEGEIYWIVGGFGSNGFVFQIRDGKLEVLYGGQSYHYGSTTILPDVWTHIAFTSNGVDIVMYINGVEDERTNVTMPIKFGSNLLIGITRYFINPSFGYKDDFPGIIDELRIWKIARSGDEIRQNFEQQLIDPRTISIENKELAAFYNFDELSGIIAYDTSGNNRDGQINGASRVEGKSGNALLFGSDDSYLHLWNEEYIDFNYGLATMEAWIKPNMIEEGEIYRIIGGYNYHNFYFQIRDGKLEVLHDGVSYHYGSTTILPDVWTHIAFTSNGVDIVTYINGVEDERTNVTLCFGPFENIKIGSNRASFDGVRVIFEEFPGIIDEFRIWNGVRTSDEIYEYYDSTNYYLDADGDGYGDANIVIDADSQPIGYVSNSTDCDDTDATVNPGRQEICTDGVDNDCDDTVDLDDPECDSLEGLIVHYSFDEEYGDIALNGAGNEYSGYIVGASRVEGKLGNALLFGSDDSYVEIRDTFEFNEGLITVDAWIKPNTIEEGEIYRIIGGIDTRYFYFQIRDGKLEVLYEGQSYHYGSTTILPDVWTHIAFTSNGVDIVTYINGVEDEKTNVTMPVQSALSNIKIGSNISIWEDSIEEFPGIIDEFRIWNGVRTSDEIYEYYDSTM